MSNTHQTLQTQTDFNRAVTAQTIDICSLVRLGMRSEVTQEDVISFGNRIVRELDERNGSWGFLDHLREFFQKCVHLIWDHEFVSDKDFARNFIISKIDLKTLEEGPLKTWITQSSLFHPKMPVGKEISPRNLSTFCGTETLKHNQLVSLEWMRFFDQKKEYAMYRDGQKMHYDWWSFPIKSSSRSYKAAFALTDEAVGVLKQDDDFIMHLREAAILVTKAWGFDLERGVKIENPVQNQKWPPYEVRLGKMAESLTLFDQEDLINNLKKFVNVNNIQLNGWLSPYLS